MGQINEITFDVNNSGLPVVPTTYLAEQDYQIRGLIDKVSMDITTASGIANNGSAWLGISGEEVIITKTALTGTTTIVAYPRRYVQNNTATQLDGLSGGNVLTHYAVGNQPLYFAGSGWGSGTSLSVGATIHVYWHKP